MGKSECQAYQVGDLKPGDIVFLENVTEAYGMDEGEHIVIAPLTLRTIKTIRIGTGYGCHETKVTSITTERPGTTTATKAVYKVIDRYYDRDSVARQIDELEEFAKEKESPSRRWRDNVYLDAKTAANRLRLVLRERDEMEGETGKVGETHIVRRACCVCGTKLVITVLCSEGCDCDCREKP